jgi:hypothetical protein
MCAALIEDEIGSRSAAAAHFAFAIAQFELVVRLMANVPNRYRNPKLELKNLVSRLPGGLAACLQRALVRPD